MKHKAPPKPPSDTMRLQDLYSRDVHANAVPSKADREEIQQRAAAGDQDARDQLVLASLAYAIKVARKYLWSGLSLDDLIQQANLGLLEAVKHYDGRGSFLTYAEHWIAQRIRFYVNENRFGLSGCNSVVDRSNRVWRTVEELMKKDGIDRTEAEKEIIARREVYGCPKRVETLREWERLFRSADPIPISLEGWDKKDGEERAYEPSEAATQHDTLEQKERIETVRRVVKSSFRRNDKKGVIIRARFGLDDDCQKTLKTVGEGMNLCRERIRQIESEALDSLRGDERLRAIS